jgi:hypothetical protein
MEKKIEECIKTESRLLKPEDQTYILINYMECLVHQKKPLQALTILEEKVKDPTALMYATNKLFLSLGSTKQLAILYSSVGTQLMINILKTYLDYGLTNKLEEKKSIQFYRANVFTLINYSDKEPINKDMKELITKHLLIIMNFIKNHPKSFEQNNYDIKKCYKELLIMLSRNRYFHKFTEGFLKYAIEQKIVDPHGELCAGIRSQLKTTLSNLK